MGTLLTVGTLLVTSVLASRLADGMGVPALLIYIGIGMLVGSDVLGWIHFDDVYLAQAVGSVALAFILFSGGLDSPVQRIRTVALPGVLLSTVGVVLTALLVALPAAALLGWPLLHGLLLGAVVASTDAAAVFSVIRGRGVAIRARVASLLELESGSNDPMALFLVIGILQWMRMTEPSALPLVIGFVVQLAGGGLIGVFGGRLLSWVVNRARLQQEGLYPVISLGAVLVVYGTAELLGGNPFLAVYLAGVGLGNTAFVHRTTITRFHDGLAWLMQVVVFLVLGLLAFPSQLPAVVMPGMALGLVLMLAARPAVVAALLLPLGWTLREAVFVGWVGLKGAVPIVLATFPLVAGVEHAEKLMPLVFFMVLLSTVVQGSTVGLSARWLGVVEERPAPLPSPLVFEPRTESEAELMDLEVAPGSFADGRRIFELGLPQDTLLVLVMREGRIMVPRGELQLLARDHVQVLAHREDLEAVRRDFSP